MDYKNCRKLQKRPVTDLYPKLNNTSHSMFYTSKNYDEPSKTYQLFGAPPDTGLPAGVNEYNTEQAFACVAQRVGYYPFAPIYRFEWKTNKTRAFSEPDFVLSAFYIRFFSIFT